MTDFRECYAAKRMSVEDLAARVQNGWTLCTDAALSEPVGFLTALAERAGKGELENVTVQTLLDVYPLELYADPSLFGKLTGFSWFSSGGARKAINEGRAVFIPNYYREVELTLSEALGRKISVTKSKGKEGGVLQIEFYSDEELTELSNKLS